MKKIIILAILTFLYGNVFSQKSKVDSNVLAVSPVFDSFINSVEVGAFTNERDEISNQLSIIDQLTEAKSLNNQNYYKLKHNYLDIYNAMNHFMNQFMVDINSLASYNSNSNSNTDIADDYLRNLTFVDSIYNVSFKPLFDQISKSERNQFSFSLENYVSGLSSKLIHTVDSTNNFTSVQLNLLIAKLKANVAKRMKFPTWESIVVAIPAGDDPMGSYKTKIDTTVYKRVIEGNIFIYKKQGSKNNIPVKVRNNNNDVPCFTSTTASDTNTVINYGFNIGINAYISVFKYSNENNAWDIIKSTDNTGGGEVRLSDLLKGGQKSNNQIEDKYLFIFTNAPLDKAKLETLKSKSSIGNRIIDDVKDIYGFDAVKFPTLGSNMFDKNNISISFKNSGSGLMVIPIYFQFGK